jgi:hypothetical protein
METIPQDRDPKLWLEAQKRAGFKRHLMTYLLMQVFFWAVWLMSKASGSDYDSDGTPWPLKVAFGWGIGLLFHGASVYLFSKDNLAEKEYEKLKNRS